MKAIPSATLSGVLRVVLLFAALLTGRNIRSARRGLTAAQPKRRDDPGGGLQGAGTPARLKPPPPLLSAGAAQALPETDRAAAA